MQINTQSAGIRAFQGWLSQERTCFAQYTLVQGDLAVKVNSLLFLCYIES